MPLSSLKTNRNEKFYLNFAKRSNFKKNIIPLYNRRNKNLVIYTNYKFNIEKPIILFSLIDIETMSVRTIFTRRLTALSVTDNSI